MSFQSLYIYRSIYIGAKEMSVSRLIPQNNYINITIIILYFCRTVLKSFLLEGILFETHLIQ